MVLFRVQDYPSISQIATKVAEKQVSVIFAVKADQVDLYKQLEEFIPNSAVGELASDSSNIVGLIKDNYQVARHLTTAHDASIQQLLLCRRKSAARSR